MKPLFSRTEFSGRRLQIGIDVRFNVRSHDRLWDSGQSRAIGASHIACHQHDNDPPTRFAALSKHTTLSAMDTQSLGIPSPRPLPPARLIVGITGASGIPYGVRLLQVLQPLPVETHLVISRSAKVTMAWESEWKPAAVEALADRVHQNDDIAACVSSGSYRTLGMVVAPCSMKTLAEIATGVTSTLIARAADVVLKERRRLVLVTREAPLHLGHLRNMVAATEMGAVIFPPVPAFYAKPQSLEDMVDHTVGRVLDLFDLEVGLAARWREDPAVSAPDQKSAP